MKKAKKFIKRFKKYLDFWMNKMIPPYDNNQKEWKVGTRREKDN
jgi:hypothetical protein